MDKTVHVLKIHKKNYEDSLKNLKTFEIIKNDRDFRVGDILKLVEYDPDFSDKRMGLIGVTGREHFKEITYILDDEKYLREGYVCLGLRLVVDEIKVTRCYECKYFGHAIGDGKHACNNYQLPYCMPEDFCSYGKRK